MKYSGSIEINQSIHKVTEVFADKDKLKDWQEGFVKKELLSGNEGENGAVSKMFYVHGDQKMELIETITANNLPNTFEAIYEHEHMDNTMKCSFTSLTDNKTKYDIVVEYTRIDWIMPRLMSILFPSMYRKPAEKWMNNFKVLAEK